MTKYDIYIELVPTELQESSIGTEGVMQFGFSRTISISGFQKAVNKWLKALLTEKGTDPSDREYGTTLVKLFGSNVTSRRDIQTAIEMAVSDATDDVFRYQEEYPSDDDSEVLDDVSIVSIVFSDDLTRVDVMVRLENREGSTLRAQIPVQL